MSCILLYDDPLRGHSRHPATPALRRGLGEFLCCLRLALRSPFTRGPFLYSSNSDLAEVRGRAGWNIPELSEAGCRSRRRSSSSPDTPKKGSNYRAKSARHIVPNRSLPTVFIDSDRNDFCGTTSGGFGLKNFHVVSLDANREGSFNSIYGDHQFSVSVVSDQDSFKSL